MADTKMFLDPNSSDYFSQLKEIFETSVVRNDRIYLKRLTEADITPEYVSFFANEEHTKYMYQSKRVITAEHLKTELDTGYQTGNYHIYGVFDCASETCIGNIRVGIITHAHKISDLAIFIGHKNFIGKGLAQEAIRLGNELCFTKYDFRKLHGGMFAENMASVKAYLKTGWVIEGVLQAQYWVNSAPMDRYCVACFNPKYFSAEFLQASKTQSDFYMNNIQTNKSGGHK